MLTGEVVGPVVVEVSARSHRAQLEDGFGAIERPTSPSPIHSIFDEVPAGAFDDARGDRQTSCKHSLVFHQAAVVAKISRCGERRLSLRPAKSAEASKPANGARDVAARATGEQREKPLLDPVLGLSVATKMEGKAIEMFEGAQRSEERFGLVGAL